MKTIQTGDKYIGKTQSAKGYFLIYVEYIIGYTAHYTLTIYEENTVTKVTTICPTKLLQNELEDKNLFLEDSPEGTFLKL